MRRLPVAIAISVLGHAAALAWVVQDSGAHAASLRPMRTSVAAPPATPAVEPMAVVLLDEQSESTKGGVDVRDEGVPAADRTRGRAAISIAAANHRDQDRSEPAASLPGPGRDRLPGAPPRSPWMTMRRAEPPAVTGPSSDFIERFVARSKPLAPPPDIPGETIAEHLADVRARMRRAGRDHPDQVDALRLEAVALVKQLEAEELKSKGGGTYQADKETFAAKVDRDGKVHFEDKRETLDMQDEMMRRRGIDPYARNKLALLDRTRDQRAALGERRHRDQLAHAAQLAQANIDRLWATTRDAAARRLALFELWDECAETGSEELVAAGAMARALVIGAIRARLRGDEAYTAAELAQLNARRRSSAVFAPYE
jgi:hypothetical protein